MKQGRSLGAFWCAIVYLQSWEGEGEQVWSPNLSSPFSCRFQWTSSKFPLLRLSVVGLFFAVCFTQLDETDTSCWSIVLKSENGDIFCSCFRWFSRWPVGRALAGCRLLLDLGEIWSGAWAGVTGWPKRVFETYPKLSLNPHRTEL